MMQALARAHSNIALVKYWGKRDERLNLPAVGSLSVTLEALWTRTRVSFDASWDSDELTLNGRPAPAMLPRVSAALDLLRELAHTPLRARIDSENNFPTAAGLASSASGFAALTVAADAALGLELSRERLSELARRGSGSAARSLFGGFVEMARGEAADGSDAVARPLMAAGDWPLEVIVAITSSDAKTTGSTAGMTRTALTSPFYDAWVRSSAGDLAAARDAVLGKDFGALAALGEHSCLKMHGLAMSAQPGLVYWNAATLECLHRIRNLRARGTGVFFTIDAGPQVKAVCLPGQSAPVIEALADVRGVSTLVGSALGPEAMVLEPPR